MKSVEFSFSADYGVGITRFPNRKRWCLFVRDGAKHFPLAYFLTETDAEMAVAALDQLARAARGDHGTD